MADKKEPISDVKHRFVSVTHMITGGARFYVGDSDTGETICQCLRPEHSKTIADALNKYGSATELRNWGNA